MKKDLFDRIRQAIKDKSINVDHEGDSITIHKEDYGPFPKDLKEARRDFKNVLSALRKIEVNTLDTTSPPDRDLVEWEIEIDIKSNEY